MSKRRKKASKKVKDKSNGDIRGIFYIALGLLLAISVYTNLAGVLSQFTRGPVYNLLGVGVFIIPIYLIYFGVNTIISKGSITYSRRLFGTSLVSITIILLCATIKLQYIETEGFTSSLQAIMLANNSGLHGGFIGHIIAYPLYKLIGFIGCYIVYISLLAIGFVQSFDITLYEIIVFCRKVINQSLVNSRSQKSTKKKSNLHKRPSQVKENPVPNVNIDNDSYIKGITNDIQIIDFMKNSEIKDVAVTTDNIEKPEKTHDNIFITNDTTSNQKSKLNSNENEVINKEIEEGYQNNKDLDEKKYRYPIMDLLKKNAKAELKSEDKRDLLENATKLEETLGSFGVEAKVLQVTKGPSVTRFELQPSPGVKVSKIVNLQDDIALGLAASGVRMEAPIPGKSAIGIEVPNTKQSPVFLRQVLDSTEFKTSNKKLAFALGEDIAGKSVVGDLSKMPHLLIAGATGSGKSVCINTLIVSLLYKYSPNEVKLLMIDPKVVELSVYNGIPHLLIPVVTDPKKAASALNWAVNEMNKRYNLFSTMKVKNIESYNKLFEKGLITEKLPYTVLIVDELADLMMACPNDVEDYICRLAQMARAAGMHLIIATQRPSVDVITGVIKANIPSRISFAVSSGIDSRTILDQVGAEKLLGRGDMLYYPIGESKPLRVQGAFISEEEVEEVVEYIKETEEEVSYEEEIINHINNESKESSTDLSDGDELLDDAIQLVIEYQQASISFLQRRLRVGFNRASRIMDELEEKGIISCKDGSRPRQVLISSSEEYQ